MQIQLHCICAILEKLHKYTGKIVMYLCIVPMFPTKSEILKMCVLEDNKNHALYTMIYNTN